MANTKEHITARLSKEVMDWVRARQNFMEQNTREHLRPSISSIIEWSLREAFSQRSELGGPPPERQFIPVEEKHPAACRDCGAIGKTHLRGCKAK